MAGLPNLSLEELRLQWRNHLGKTAPAHLPKWLLTREWNGRIESVMVLEECCAWKGATFRSLSRVAKAITGTNWNGHRFFGLRAAAKRGKSPEVETARSTREEPR